MYPLIRGHVLFVVDQEPAHKYGPATIHQPTILFDAVSPGVYIRPTCMVCGSVCVLEKDSAHHWNWNFVPGEMVRTWAKLHLHGCRISTPSDVLALMSRLDREWDRQVLYNVGFSEWTVVARKLSPRAFGLGASP